MLNTLFKNAIHKDIHSAALKQNNDKSTRGYIHSKGIKKIREYLFSHQICNHLNESFLRKVLPDILKLKKRISLTKKTTYSLVPFYYI